MWSASTADSYRERILLIYLVNLCSECVCCEVCWAWSYSAAVNKYRGFMLCVCVVSNCHDLLVAEDIPIGTTPQRLQEGCKKVTRR